MRVFSAISVGPRGVQSDPIFAKTLVPVPGPCTGLICSAGSHCDGGVCVPDALPGVAAEPETPAPVVARGLNVLHPTQGIATPVQLGVSTSQPPAAPLGLPIPLLLLGAAFLVLSR